MRLQNNNYVYTLAEKPSWDNVIALIIYRRGNRYHCLLLRLSDITHPSDAHPATSRRTIICANTGTILHFTPSSIRASFRAS